MQPLLLDFARREGADAQNLAHLRHTGQHLVPGDEPADALVTGRAGQAALVGPEVVEAVDLVEGEVEAHLHGELAVGLVEVQHGRGKLVDEARVVGRVVEATGGVHHEAQHGLLVALGVDVHQVQLGPGRVAVDAVVARGVDVPAGHVDGLVVELHRRQLRVIALRVVEVEGRAVAPVEVLAGPRALVAGEVRGVDLVAQDGGIQIDGRLLGAGLAELIVCWL